MNLIEKKMNLFEVDDKYYFAHCISSDCAMGAGIAVEFEKRFKLRRKLLSNGYIHRKHPACIFINNVFNLITKELYHDKPTYETLKGALIKMRDIILEEDINYIAMPKIGCGLDRLQWGKVKEDIQEIFKDTDIEILVCYL
jgi:hypothetical protein